MTKLRIALRLWRTFSALCHVALAIVGAMMATGVVHPDAHLLAFLIAFANASSALNRGAEQMETDQPCQ